MELIENIPFKFGEEIDPCFVSDGRRYCQMVQQTDHFWFGVKGSKCYDCPSNDDYDTDVSCVFNPTVPSGNWSLDSVNYYFHTTGATAPLTAATSQKAGYWEITFTIKKVTGTALAGSILVSMAGVVHSPAFTTEGTFKVYITSTNTGALAFTPSSTFNGLVGDVSFSLVETNYKLVAFDLATDTKVDEWLLPSKTRDYFYITGLWNTLGLNNGCYYFKVLDGCLNGDASDNLLKLGGWNLDTSGCVTCCGGSTAEGSLPSETVLELTVCGNVDLVSQYFAGIFETGVCYTITYTALIDPTDSAVQFMVIAGGVNGTLRTTSGTFSQNITAGFDVLRFRAEGTSGVTAGKVTISNISITVCESSRQYSNQSACYDIQTIHPCTKYLSWTNDDSAFNLPYSYATIVHYLRVYAIKDRPRYPEESDRFKNSAGTKSINFASSEKVWKLRFDYLPEYLHDAIRLAKIHDHFYIDGVEYSCVEGNYDPEWRGQLRLAQSEIEVMKVTEDNTNYNCG